MAFGGPRSSCVRPGVHSARRQDSHKDWTPCRMAWPFVSAGAHAPDSDETLDPTPTRGSSHSARRLRSLAFLCSSLVSTLGFSTPGIVPKGPHPLSVEGVRHLATVPSHQIVLFAEHGKDLEHSFATGVVFEGAVSLHEFKELLQGLFAVAAHH